MALTRLLEHVESSISSLPIDSAGSSGLFVCGRHCPERGHFVDPLPDRLFLNNVLLNNRLDFVGGHVCVPNSIRPNHENRASFAYSQAVDFAP